jgi:hypothetical protein
MTTFFDFVPTSAGPFQFQPTLDGQVYTGIVTWNVFGRRYYLNLYDLSGALVFCMPLIGSPSGFPLQSLSWAAGIVTATTEDGALTGEHNVGETVDLTIQGATPGGFNGSVAALITGGSTFTYAVAADPGPTVYPGNANQIINLVEGYFSTSTLVYRAANKQIEVTP